MKLKYFVLVFFTLLLLGCSTENRKLQKKFGITYHGNGYTSGQVPTDSLKYNEGESIFLAQDGTMERSGYTFLGWDLHPDSNTAAYSAGGSIEMINQDINLYAIWSYNNTYSVTYDGNGYTSGNVPTDSSDYQEGENVVLLQSGSMIRPGYNFLGWDLSAESTTAAYAAGVSLTMPPNNVTLFAIWEYIQVNDISISETSVFLEFGELYQITATVLPSNAENYGIIWTSDNEECVLVDQQGNLTTIKPGTGTIIAKTGNESIYAECFVTVTSTPIHFFTYKDTGSEIILTGFAPEYLTASELQKRIIHIPEKINDKPVTTIAFSDSTNKVDIEEFHISRFVSNITAESLNNMENLKLLSFPESLENLGNVYVSGTTITIMNKDSDYWVFHDTKKIESIIVDPENQFFCTDKGILYDIDKETLIYYPSTLETTDLILSESVRNIRTMAFQHNPFIQTLKLSENFKYHANPMFWDLPNLNSITIMTPNVNGYEAIGGVLYYDTALLRFPPNYVAESFTVPSAIKSLLGYSFYNSDLVEITLPASIISIDLYSFNECSNLSRLIIYATSVPLIFGEFLTNTPETLKIYVPDSSVSIYKTSPVWSSYADQIFSLNDL